MNSLFQSEPIFLNLPDAEVIYYPNFFDNEEANKIYNELKETTPWQQDEIVIYGKKLMQPRLTALYGNVGRPYSYSGLTMQSHHWTMLLQKIKYHVESVANVNFSTVLLNYYRDGKDSMGWHADDEKELGTNPIIASISFGEERIFQLKHNTIANLRKNILLEHGSLLITKGATQHFWKHQIAKTAQPIGGRINLTFREIF